MKFAPMRSQVSLLAIVSLLACGTESAESPFAPEADIAAHRSRSDALRFSDWSNPVNLGDVVNSASGELEVAISRDGRSLYFSSNRPGGLGGFDIWVSQRASVDAPWGTPVNLGPTVNTAAREQAPALSRDGRELYFFSDRPGGFGAVDIYVSRRGDKRDDLGWLVPENVGSGVNTPFNDQLPAYFSDDETGTATLFFNSNRPGGVGGTDIYASARQGDGTFGAAALVAELSSPLQDAGIAIRRDGLEAILTSNRTGSLPPERPGQLGFDLWVSTRASTSGPWSTPVNLGLTVNTASDEARLAMSFDGTTLYITSDRPGSIGNLDVWVSTRTKLRGGDDGYEDDDEDDDRWRHHRRGDARR